MVAHFFCSFCVKFKKQKSRCSQQAFPAAPQFLVSSSHWFLLQQGRGSTALGEFIVIVILTSVSTWGTSAHFPSVKYSQCSVWGQRLPFNTLETQLHYFISECVCGTFWCQMENFFVMKYFPCCMPRQFSFISHCTNLMTTHSSIKLFQEFVPFIDQIEFLRFPFPFQTCICFSSNTSAVALWISPPRWYGGASCSYPLSLLWLWNGFVFY